jgi:ABC-2 type transport system ATP-binding protein
MVNTAIKVSHLSKNFKLPHEKTTSIKSALVNFYRSRKSYEMQQALNDISFEIQDGEFFGIVGRNGSGKSTLLKTLAGIYVPTSGSVEVRGKLTPFIELGVGFNPELTGRENVYLNGALLGFNRKEMNAMYKNIVEFAELKRFMDQKLKNYSSGMQVRLAFSIAIRANSDILLIDEVLAVGDAAFQQKCYNYFEELKLKNKTVVFVSHDMGAVRRFCNRAVYIKEGKIIGEGDPNEIANLYAEENINTGENSIADDLKLSPNHEIKARIAEKDANGLTIKINYSSKDRQEMYIGLALTKDGFSIAEIATDHSKPLVGKGSLSYRLDTSPFNGGNFEVAGVSLFRLRNRELLAINKKKMEFTVPGNDLMRGGALKLNDEWLYE